MSCKSLLFVLIRFQVLLLTFFGSDCQILNTTLEVNTTESSFPKCKWMPNNTTPELEDYEGDDDQYLLGGTESYLGEFPFMAALGWINDTGELNFHGGGMVISPRMILTAAHCVYKDGKLPDLIFLGGNPLYEASFSFLNVFSNYTVANVTIFPKYSSKLAYDDIAIFEINEPTWYPPVCLWRCKQFKGKGATAIGYGLTEFAGVGSEQLLKVNLTIFSSEYCGPFFKRQRKFKSGLTDSQICAGDKDGKKDTCQGDSGGPLLIKQKNQIFAIGLTSSGQACSGFPPAIYTKIQPYIGWIENVLEERGESLLDCGCDTKHEVTEC